MHSEHFDQKAATWDDDPAKVERAETVARHIAAVVPLRPSTRLLEYGAGTGLISEALRDHVGPLTLADASSGMREVMEAKVESGVLPGARIWSLDLAVEPPPDERFDLIVTVMVLHHIPELDLVLERFLALLDSGGRLCIVDLDAEEGGFHGEGFGGQHGFDRTELAGDLARAGFGEVVVSDCSELEKDGQSYSLFLACGTRP